MECESKYNTPILPIRKPYRNYQIVQDLRAINRIVEDLYPLVAYPHTLFTTLSGELAWFTVLDLKDAFFCLLLSLGKQLMFAFEWENPDWGRRTQLTWTVLLQGFTDSPTLFGNELAKDLEQWLQPPGQGTLLQYIDDLIATETKEVCVARKLLNFLRLNGYWVSPQKAQVARPQVTYLGYEIAAGSQTLGNNEEGSNLLDSRTSNS